MIDRIGISALDTMLDLSGTRRNLPTVLLFERTATASIVLAQVAAAELENGFDVLWITDAPRAESKVPKIVADVGFCPPRAEQLGASERTPELRVLPVADPLRFDEFMAENFGSVGASFRRSSERTVIVVDRTWNLKARDVRNDWTGAAWRCITKCAAMGFRRTWAAARFDLRGMNRDADKLEWREVPREALRGTGVRFVSVALRHEATKSISEVTVESRLAVVAQLNPDDINSIGHSEPTSRVSRRVLAMSDECKWCGGVVGRNGVVRRRSCWCDRTCFDAHVTSVGLTELYGSLVVEDSVDE